jgi:flagellar hook assembly protein FlgD
VVLAVHVYDVAGRLVRMLHRGPLPAGTISLVWDGHDRFGHRVAAGVYLFRVTEPGRHTVTARSVRVD